MTMSSSLEGRAECGEARVWLPDLHLSEEGEIPADTQTLLLLGDSAQILLVLAQALSPHTLQGTVRSL